MDERHLSTTVSASLAGKALSNLSLQPTLAGYAGRSAEFKR